MRQGEADVDQVQVVVLTVEWPGDLGVTETVRPVEEYREALAMVDWWRGLGAVVRVTSARGLAIGDRVIG
jgi:hypothetical protein